MKNTVFSLAGLTIACAAGTASADIISNDPYALGGGRSYFQVGKTIVPGETITLELEFEMRGPPHYPPQPGTGPLFGECDGLANIRVTLNGSAAGDAGGHMHCSFFDVFTEFSPDGSTQFFDTEMLSMDLSFDLPGLGLMMIRESPTRQSVGKYYVQGLSHLDSTNEGPYRINSFFDVFTELSRDGGQTWTPIDAPMHFELGPTVPAPGVASLLALSGVFAVRRRRN